MRAIGEMYFQQGQFDKARKIFEGLVALDPQSGAAHAALGALYVRTFRYEEALKHLNCAIELDARQMAAYLNRAEIRIHQQQFESAVADLKRVMDLDPTGNSFAAGRARAMALGIRERLKTDSGTPNDTESGQAHKSAD
jgi:tetratricopeptide (TPR) repeat protein